MKISNRVGSQVVTPLLERSELSRGWIEGCTFPQVQRAMLAGRIRTWITLKIKLQPTGLCNNLSTDAQAARSAIDDLVMMPRKKKLRTTLVRRVEPSLEPNSATSGGLEVEVGKWEGRSTLIVSDPTNQRTKYEMEVGFVGKRPGWSRSSDGCSDTGTAWNRSLDCSISDA